MVYTEHELEGELHNGITAADWGCQVARNDASSSWNEGITMKVITLNDYKSEQKKHWLGSQSTSHL